MSERKPPGVSWETWSDRQIREAQESGAFDGLTGKGKPLRSAGSSYDEMWWVKDKMRREGLSFLPPSLALRKEAEDAEAAIAEAVSERQVRRILEVINEKLAAAIRRPPEGPPLGRGLFDVERTVAQWHEARERRLRAEAETEAVAAAAAEASGDAADQGGSAAGAAPGRRRGLVARLTGRGRRGGDARSARGPRGPQDAQNTQDAQDTHNAQNTHDAQAPRAGHGSPGARRPRDGGDRAV